MTTKILVTGIGGFVGTHLAHYLVQEHAHEVYGTVLFPVAEHPHLSQLGVQLTQIDLTDEFQVKNLLDTVKPDQIFHLAGQSFVPESFRAPWETLHTNIKSQLNLLDTMAQQQTSARILIVGSAEVYGRVPLEDLPVDESQLLAPTSPYSVSKVAQDMLAFQYFHSHNVQAIRVRPFNQIGPGQSERFVAPSFASQIASIEIGAKEPVIRVGNLEAIRDFTDVRDMVRAYSLMMQYGIPGEVYNVGTGIGHSIKELLEIMISLSRKPVDIQSDPELMRPIEVPVMLCNPARFKAATQWKPEFTFDQTLSSILDEWRMKQS
jgi:GDP-4-dehydro-6-deoxy-D-mannose reductase